MGAAVPILVALGLTAAGCASDYPVTSPVEDDDSAGTGGDDTAIDDDSATDDDSAVGDDTSGDDDTATSPVDPELVSPSSALFDVLDYTVLNKLSGGTNTGYSTAVSEYLDGAMASLTATSANSYGHYKVTLFGDRATFDRGNGQTQTVAYVAITADYADVAAAPAAETLIRGAEMDGNLGISGSYMAVLSSIIYNSDGTVASASATITQYGSDPDANSLHTLLYPGSEQQVTVIENYTQTPATFTDATELENAQTATEDLLSGMTLEQGEVEYVTIEGDEF